MALPPRHGGGPQQPAAGAVAHLPSKKGPPPSAAAAGGNSGSSGGGGSSRGLRRLHRGLSQFVSIKEAEVAPTLLSFAALFAVLSSYFVLLPLREDAGISLGTSTLPLLFAASLLVTLVFTPLASAFLTRAPPGRRDVALKQLYSGAAAALVGFWLCYNAAAVGAFLGQHARSGSGGSGQGAHAPVAAAAPWQRSQQAAAFQAGAAASTSPPSASQQRFSRALLAVGALTSADDAAAPLPPAAAAAAAAAAESAAAAAAAAGGAPPATTAAATLAKAARRRATRDGDASLSRAQRLLRGTFYVFVGTLNLIGISSLWARCADAFSADAGARLFGFISAGATLGQFAGSLVAMFVARAAEAIAATARGGAAHPEVAAAAAAAPPASGLILLAALLQLVAAQLICRVRPVGSSAPPPGAATAGAATAAMLRQTSRQSGSGLCRAASDGGGPALSTALPSKATSNGLRLINGNGGAAGTTAAVAVAAAGPPLSSSSPPPAAAAAAGSGGGGGGGGLVPHLLAGFRLIAASPYLLCIVWNLLLTYLVGSLIYFQRALVVSSAAASLAGGRTAFFAALNTWSAGGVLVLQLFATSSLLRALGVAAALASGPLCCLAGLAAVSARPLPAVVAAFEIVRKLLGYALIRPAREVLFTVVPRDEKYAAKLVIDTVVQRAGDALAAGAFHVLDGQLDAGQVGVGAAGAAMCLVWFACAQRLGRQHKRLADARA